MSRRFQFSLTLLTTLLCVPLGCLGQRMEVVRHARAAEPSAQDLMRRDQAAEPLRRKIRREIKALEDHEWAGEYYEGTGTGTNISLMLAPKSGFVFEWRGCTSLYHLHQGQVVDDGKHRLTFSFPNQREGSGLAHELIPVVWGTRQYLIAPEKMIDFCNAVNGGLQEPRKGLHGVFLLRCGDELKQTSGTPGVPDEFKSYLLSNPIDAELMEVKERPGKKTSVRLNRGKIHGLLPGMELHVLNPDVLLTSVKVTACEDEACDADMTRVRRNGPAPRVGWKLSTSWRIATDKPITNP